MTSIKGSGQYNLTIEQLWILTTTPENIPRWITNIQSCVFDPQATLTTGSKITLNIKTVSASIGISLSLQVEKIEPPHKLTLRGEFNYVEICVYLSLLDLGDKCQVDLRLNIEQRRHTPILWSSILFIVFRKMLPDFIQRALEKLGDISM